MRISLIILASFLYASIYDVSKLAIEKNYKIKSLFHQLKSKKYVIKQYQGKLFPQIKLNANYGLDKYQYIYPTQTVKYNSKTYSYTFSLTQTLYNPQIFALIKDSKLKYKYQSLTNNKFKSNLIAEVSKTYIDAITYKEIENIYKQKVQKLKDSLNEAKAKYSLKLATKDEVEYINYLYQKALSDLENAKLTKNYLITKLKLLTNSNINLNDNIYFQTFNIDSLNYKSNYDLQLAKINLKISKNEVKKRRYNLYPNLDVSLSYSDTHSNDSITRRHNFRAFLEFSMPLFNKTTNEYINEALELYKSSIYELKDTQNNTKISFIQTKNNFLKFKATINKDKANLKSTTILLEKSQISYNNKLISLTDLVKTQNDFYDNLITLKKDIAEYTKSYIDLLNISGKLNLEKLKNL